MKSIGKGGESMNGGGREDGQVDQCGRQHNRRGVEMAERGRSEEERVGECHFLALMPPFLSLWGGHLEDVHSGKG